MKYLHIKYITFYFCSVSSYFAMQETKHIKTH